MEKNTTDSEVDNYMKDNNYMYPISGMKMSGKSIVVTDEKGNLVRWQPIPEETEDNRKIYNDYLKEMQELESKMWWGSK